DHLLAYLLVASLLGGALSVGLIWFRMAPLPERLTRHAWIARLHAKDAGIPYGVALAAAALAVYPDTAWMAGATRGGPAGGAPRNQVKRCALDTVTGG